MATPEDLATLVTAANDLAARRDAVTAAEEHHERATARAAMLTTRHRARVDAVERLDGLSGMWLRLTGQREQQVDAAVQDALEAERDLRAARAALRASQQALADAREALDQAEQADRQIQAALAAHADAPGADVFDARAAALAEERDALEQALRQGQAAISRLRAAEREWTSASTAPVWAANDRFDHYNRGSVKAGQLRVAEAKHDEALACVAAFHEAIGGGTLLASQSAVDVFLEAAQPEHIDGDLRRAMGQQVIEEQIPATEELLALVKSQLEALAAREDALARERRAWLLDHLTTGDGGPRRHVVT